MKKVMKGILSGLLSLAMCFSMTSPILAQEEEVNDTTENTTEEAVTEETEETTESEEVEEQVEEQTSTQEAKDLVYSTTVAIQFIDGAYSTIVCSSSNYPDQAAQAMGEDGNVDPYQFAKLMMPYDNYAVNSSYSMDDAVCIFKAYPINTETFYTNFKVLDADGNQIYSAGNYAVSGNLNDYADYSYPNELLSDLADQDIELQGDSFSIDENTELDGYIYEDDQAYGVYNIDVSEKQTTIVYQTYNNYGGCTELGRVSIDKPDDIEQAITDNMTFTDSNQYVVTDHYQSGYSVYVTVYKGSKVSVKINFIDWSTDKTVSTVVDNEAVLCDNGNQYFHYSIPETYAYSTNGALEKDDEGNYTLDVYCYNNGDTRDVTAYYVYDGALLKEEKTTYNFNSPTDGFNIPDGYEISTYYPSSDYKSVEVSLAKIAYKETSTVTVNYINWMSGKTLNTVTEDITVRTEGAWSLKYDYAIDSDMTQEFENYTADDPVYKDGKYTVNVYLWNADDEKEVTVKYTRQYSEVYSETTITAKFDDVISAIEDNAPEGYTVNSTSCKDGVYYANIYSGSSEDKTITKNVYSWSTGEKLGTVDLVQHVETVEGDVTSQYISSMQPLYDAYDFHGYKTDDEGNYYIYKATDKITLPVTFVKYGTNKEITTKTMTVSAFTNESDFTDAIPEGYYYIGASVYIDHATVSLTTTKPSSSTSTSEQKDLTVQLVDWKTNQVIKEEESVVWVYHYGETTYYNPDVDYWTLCKGYDGYIFNSEDITLQENGKYLHKIYVYDYTDMKTVNVTYVDYTTGAVVARKSFDSIAGCVNNAIQNTYVPAGYITNGITPSYADGMYTVKVMQGAVTKYTGKEYYINWVTGEEIMAPHDITFTKTEGGTFSYVSPSNSYLGLDYDGYYCQTVENNGQYSYYNFYYKRGDTKNVTYTYVCDGKEIKTEPVKVNTEFDYGHYINVPENYYRSDFEIQLNGDCIVTCEAISGSASPSGSESAEGSPSYSDIYIASDSYKMAPGASQTLELINTGDKEIESVSWSANDSVTITEDASDPLKATLKVNSSATDGTFVSIAAKVKINGNTYTYTTSIVVVADSYKFKLNGLTSKTTAESKSNYSFTPVITDNATGKTVDLDSVNAKFYIVSFDGVIKDAKGITLKAGEEVDANQTFTLTYDPEDGTQKLVAGITYGDESGYTQGLHKTYTFTKSKTTSEEFDPAQTTSVTAKNGSTGIELSWNAVTKATGYKLYRKIGTGSWKLLKTVSGTSYTDTGLTSGTTYSYRLKATDGNSTSTNYTTTVSLVYLTAPVVSSLSNAKTKMTAKWSAVTGATSYSVTVKNADTDEVLKEGTTTKTSYDITGVESGINTKVEVQAVSGNCVSVAGSKTVMRLDQPSIYSIKTTDGQALIMWDAVAGATSYTVYRKVSGESSWTELVTQDATSVDLQAYLDEEVTSGTTYLYTIKAFCGSVVSAYDKTGTTLAVPANTTVSASITSTGEKLSWKAVTGATKYYLTITYKDTDEIVVNSFETTETSYQFSEAVPGVKYTAKVVTAIGTNFSSGATKNFVYVDESVIQSATNTAEGIHLEWNQSEGATKYTVYRKVKGESKYTSLNTKVTDTSYDDTTAVAGTAYIYMVRAYNGSTSALYDKTGVTVTRLTQPVVSIANKTSGITVSWKAVTGATSYTVKRIDSISIKSDGSNEVTVTGKTTTFKELESGEQYLFTVVANAEDGSKSCESTKKSLTRLSTPTLDSVINTDDGIGLEWDEVDGATTYKIYRKGKTGSYTEIATVDATENELTQAYIDTKVKSKSGYTYSYYVRAYKDSDASYYKAVTTMRLLAPEITKCTPKNTYTGVTFTSVTGAESYTVYRVDDEGNRTEIKTVTATTATSYTVKDSKATKAGTYHYQVVANAGSYTSAAGIFDYI